MDHLGMNPAPPQPQAYAAIDLGTNNCRMLVARPYGDGFRVVDSFSRIVRLGEGVAAKGRLSPAAIKRTVNALKVCNAKLKSIGAKRVRSIATEACRRAENGADFMAQVKEQAKIDLETISAHEEAALTLTGCSPLLDQPKSKALVFDIGGGSTEVLWVDTKNRADPKTIDVISLPHGVVTLTEFFNGKTNVGESYEDIVELISQELNAFSNRHNIAQAVRENLVQMLGTSGTVTTLGALHLNLGRYDRSKIDGLVLEFDHIRTVLSTLSALTPAERTKNPCIGPKRSDLIMSGCAVLDAVCRLWPVGSLVVADRGIREGIILKLMAEDGIHIKRSPHEGSGCLS